MEDEIKFEPESDGIDFTPESEIPTPPSFFSKLKNSFVGTIAKDITTALVTKPLVRTGQAIATGITELTGIEEEKRAMEEVGKEPFKTPIGEVEPAKAFEQIGGEAVETAALLAPYGKIAGRVAGGITSRFGRGVATEALGKTAKTIGDITAGALGGYSFDVAQKMKEEQPVGEVIRPGIGTALGVAIPGGIKTVSALTGKIRGQAGRVIDSLIKPLLKDFSYGKHPGKAVAAENIVADTWDELTSAITKKRQTLGRELGRLAGLLEGKSTLDLTKAIKPIDEAMEIAASTNNANLLQRLQNVKQALSERLTLGIQEGKEAIVSEGQRNLQSAGFQEGIGFKQMIGDMTTWTGNPSDDKLINSTLKKSYGIAKETILNTADSVSLEIGKQIRKLSERYASLTSAEIAAKYRNKLIERQNLISMPATVGTIVGLTTALATGGAAIPAVLAGVVVGLLDKAMGTPAFKTRLASWLTKESPSVIGDVITKNPGIIGVLKKYFDKAKFPGDAFLDSDLGKKASAIVDDYAKNPKIELGVGDVSKKKIVFEGTELADTIMGLPVEKKTPAFDLIQPSGKRIAKLTPDNLEVGAPVSNAKGDYYIITDVLGDGKFKAVPKEAFERFNLSVDSSREAVRQIETRKKTFDISQKTTTQQGIKLTPEIKAKIRGEAPVLKKPSGKSPVSAKSQEKPELAIKREIPGTAKLTWRQFVGERMSAYMKSEGGHAGAMKRISKEWADYKK